MGRACQQPTLPSLASGAYVGNAWLATSSRGSPAAGSQGAAEAAANRWDHGPLTRKHNL
jgi:hypothetical protein